MSISAVRISKTSMKRWTLHGPIDQALKTTIQADAVRVVSLYAPDEEVELEVWVGADDQNHHQPNIPVMAMIALSEARRSGENLPTIEDEENLTHLVVTSGDEPIFGPAVLTGPGGTDLPEVNLETLMSVLMGM